ncbi:ComEC/Rec2-related domain-containing protein [Natrinema altunense JCM 12890]|uniref:ComEC/Rec2-related domain-containing protein n=2 Tax=Natrinema altunense TaxID=222984 RepID=L9ZH63_NATA2|nr:ComEC/Rec2-related domain-containing protein [Natrinema altunense JCM 12890]
MFGRVNQVLKENDLLHAVIAMLIVFAIDVGFSIYNGEDPSFIEAIGSGVFLGVIYYGGIKYAKS